MFTHTHTHTHTQQDDIKEQSCPMYTGEIGKIHRRKDLRLEEGQRQRRLYQYESVLEREKARKMQRGVRV